MRVFKYQACGNDFLVVLNWRHSPALRPDFSRAICRRHFGVGADGCVFLSKVSGRRAHYRIFNRDGSEAGFSGNGARCAAAFLQQQGLVRDEEVILVTRAGDKPYRRIESSDGAWIYRSLLGRPDFRPEAIPFHHPEAGDEVIGFPIAVGSTTLPVTALSMGNTQCQVLLEALPDDDDFRRWGAALEKHPCFPRRTNVGFVSVEDRHNLQLRIWERGVGPTLSSGTGSSSAAVAAIVNGRCVSPVAVQTRGGVQTVEWSRNVDLVLTGPAVFVAEIDYPDPA